MMIELTVKTLDSQNHSFTVNDEITVAEFKQKISETINIPADTQRIIYCGRILKDDVKLSEYDVNGKVVHLVQRAPPTSSQNTNRTTSPQPQRRNIRGLEHGMYLGSMAFPSNLMETQGIVPPPPTHSLAASRLNVAKRMLRRAEGVLSQLENPTARNSDQASSEEPQEEVTPVFEARVIVPSNSLNEPINEVISAVQNSLLNATPVPINGGPDVIIPDNLVEADILNGGSTSSAAANNIEMDSPPLHSASSTPDGASPISASVENLTSDQRNGNNGEAAGTTDRPSTEGTNGNSLAENASRTTEMADLLETLGRLQIRLAPFLEQYQNFMRQDPSVPAEDVRKTQAMINRVSEILHFLGHAYHSLSDIIVRVRTPPPRPLLCRPILIQHSAVVQTGFPIQVEAEINISPDHIQPNTAPSTQQTTSTVTTSTTSSGVNVTTPSGSSFTAHIPSHMLGLPLIPGSVHVQSFPIEIRGIHRATNLGNNAGASTTNPATSNSGVTSSSTTDSTVTETTTSGTTTTTTETPTTTASSNSSPYNNRNVEFFMEVTPESISIDSLRTTLMGPNQADDFISGVVNREFLQTMMQMTGQILNRSSNQQTATTTNTTSGSATTSGSDSSQASSTQSSVNTNASNVGQNSQARGNTQTNPTTSTHTRSTARPHVHLAQHAMQGFDPFLPCNSHHVTPRRRIQARNVPPQNNQNNNTRQETPMQGVPIGINPNQLHPIYNIVQGIVNSFRNAYRQRSTQPNSQNATATTSANTNNNSDATAVPPSEPTPSAPPVMPMPFLPHLQNMNISDISGSHGPTLSQLMEQFSDDNYVEGESIFTDLIMLLSRNLTITDLIRLNNGQLEPLMRMRAGLRTFFLQRVLDGNVNSAAIDRGVNRFITEMQPLLDNLENLIVRDDIDIVRSTQMLFRTRLPNIISLAASRNPNSLRMLVDQCSITLRQLCALILHASANGQQGVEDILDHIVRQYMQGVPRVFEAWTSVTSRAQLRQFISNLSVPESILQPYIVRNVESVTSPVIEVNQDKPSEEPMELDEQEAEASGSSNDLSNSVVNLQNDTEPLPSVDIGSESWHDQVPAEWVPIIVRDTHRQRRQGSQPAFSDAYLSGMPSKRRKIVTNAKPQGSLPQVIQDSVRRAVTASGLTTAAPLETVSQAAASDINVQSAYRELLRSSVQSTLQDNEDFTPERYPNASNYFNKPQ